MLSRRVLSNLNPLRYCTRYYAVAGDAADNREQWRTRVSDQLVSRYGNQKFIRKLFAENPEFEKSDFNIWKNFMQTLSVNGFEYKDCFNILRKYPDVLGYPPEHLDNAVNKWKTIFPSDMLRFLILNHPEFFNLDPKTIGKRGEFLLSYCVKREALLALLFFCPNLMYDNWEEVIEKMEYLNDEMVVYRAEVFYCKALSKPLRHIKLRFSILEKCGRYIRPNPVTYKQTKKERLRLNNPSLRHVTDKSDASFAKRVAKISVEEYETYSDLFDMYENEDLDSESDSDEDG